MHRDPHLVQPRERSCSDPADDNRVYFLIIERLHRITCAVRVVLVPVDDRRNAVRVGIENEKYGR
jgi:hypothetical protein